MTPPRPDDGGPRTASAEPLDSPAPEAAARDRRRRAPVERPAVGAAGAAAVVAAWAVTRALLLLAVAKVILVPGPDVTVDVSVIYRNWADVLATGTFPEGDVTWQYPPAAALPMLAPKLLAFLDYPQAFFVLACAADALVLGLLLRAARRPSGEGRVAGAWVWVAGVPLLGPTVYARYDVMVTAVTVAALLALARRPRLAGVLAGFGALLKVWPVLVLIGAPRGRPTRRAWTAAALTALVLTGVFAAAMPGALGFLTAQRDRGLEVESLGALVFHVARQFGWEGWVILNYGSMEFLGHYVDLVSNVALAASLAVFVWLLVWRLRARAWTPGTHADAAFAAVLLFTVTSRVLSPQYLVWLVGCAAVCCALRASRQGLPAVLVLAASGLTVLEFPVWFGRVVASEPLGVAVLGARNALLVAATVIVCVRLWRSTMREDAGRAPGLSPAAGARNSASAR